MARVVKFIGTLRATYQDGGNLDAHGQSRSVAALDVLCRNSSGGTLSGSKTNGCDLVMLDMANFVEGRTLPIAKSAASAGTPALGVIVEDQADSIAAGDQCWVRIFGVHEYAAVDGTTDVAAGDALAANSSAGSLAKHAAGNQLIALSLDARTANSVGPQRVFLINPLNVTDI